MLRTSIRWIALVVGCLLTRLSASAADPALAKRHVEVLNQEVIPAYQRGNPLQVLQTLSPILGRLDDERIALADEVLRQQNVPPISKLLADARRTLVEQGLENTLPKPTLREVAIVAPRLAAEIKDIVADISLHPAMVNPPPRYKVVAKYEHLFWQIHVMQNRLINARRLAQYTDQFVRQLRAGKLDKLAPHQREAIQADYSGVLTQVDDAQLELGERSLQFRLDRLRLAANELLEPGVSEEKFLAAYSVATDSRILKDYLRSGAPTNRAALAGPEVLAEVEWLETVGRERGGDLITKSELLFHGLHWWLRGRYGQGTDGFGLFKGEVALNSPEDMFRLNMPREPSEAAKFVSDADNAYPVPRRHFYTWAWEDRVVPFRKVEYGFW